MSKHYRVSLDWGFDDFDSLKLALNHIKKVWTKESNHCTIRVFWDENLMVCHTKPNGTEFKKS